MKFLIFGLLLFSCELKKEKGFQTLPSKVFCLDVERTCKQNDIKIGKGTLTLKGNMTFEIVNDSSKFSNIIGQWDTCCKASGWKNYIFKPQNHIRQMVNSPEFEVIINDKIFFLFFKKCD